LSKREIPGRAGLTGAEPRVGRRSFLRLAGSAGAAAGLGGLVAACRGDGQSFTGRKLLIAYVGMQSGALAAVGEADAFVVNQVRERLADGIQLGPRRHPVEILTLDNQSDIDRATQVTNEVLASKRVDVVLASGLSPTVAEVCERRGVPCVTTLLPYDSHYLARRQLGGGRQPPSRWAYHFFWGLPQGWSLYMDLWAQLPTNKVVGLLLPDDPDGRIWGDPARGFGAQLLRSGFAKVVTTGLHAVGVPSFREDIALFKAADADIVAGLLYPPDFATFWKQCDELGYRPKILTMGRALLSPSFLEAVEPSPSGASTDVWWSPRHPYRSSLTGETAAQLAGAYSASAEKQWIQPLGFTHALFEVAVTALTRAGTADDPGAVAAALKRGPFDTVVGRIDWAKGARRGSDLPPNSASTPLAGGQWREVGGSDPFELEIVNHADALDIPTTSRLQPLPDRA
jgi:branched-chain amino acid transport system substrate-binding protein